MLISRKQYDALCEAVRVLGAVCEDYKGHMKTERARYDALIEKYHALKLQGAESVPPVVQYTPIVREKDDELKLLIADQAGGDLRKRGLMLRQLAQDRADGVSPEEIRRSIEQGVQAEGVPA
jgi:hypothetical protein